jgi:hypothetical protein
MPLLLQLKTMAAPQHCLVRDGNKLSFVVVTSRAVLLTCCGRCYFEDMEVTDRLNMKKNGLSWQLGVRGLWQLGVRGLLAL